MDMVSALAENYTAKYSSEESTLLANISAETASSHAQAHMLSGQTQGQFLRMLSTLIRPKYILEIGTFTGYSALCLAEGLDTDGELHTIELREEDANTAQQNFHKSIQNKQITLHRGNALEIIDTLHYTWDLVFIDADKTGYIQYYEKIIPKLADNGLILADNVLFHGQVLVDPIQGKNAKAIHAFNEHVKNDPRTEQVLITLRDGISLIKKKKA
jgi:caffeoyl-CoA O-methyltransferase